MIKQMNVQELKEKLDNSEKIILIDCREQDEWDQGHIDGAKLYSLSSFPKHIENLTDKNAEIIVQCRSGKRSMNACQLLQENGFTNLSNLEGGILDWAEQQLPIKTS